MNTSPESSVASHLQIQPITSQEQLPTCAAVLAEAYNAPPWNDSWTNEKALEKLECFFQTPKFIGLMVVESGQVLGCCVGNIEPYYTGDYFYLKEMFVGVQAQHKGVGAQLMAALKAHLASIGIEQIILFTSKDVFPFDFYLKHHFQEIDGMRMMHFAAAEV